MNISYAITCHNEGKLLDRLFSSLLPYYTSDDEIIILDDYSDDKETEPIITKVRQERGAKLYRRHLDGDFAAQKNYLNSLCTREWILQLDADEVLPNDFVSMAKAAIEANPEVDVFNLPRANVVEGITVEHIIQWGWRINDNGWINWPDYQARLYRNCPSIHWSGKVHEQLIGMKRYASFPAAKDFALIHNKTIDRQERQNSLYNNIVQGGGGLYVNH